MNSPKLNNTDDLIELFLDKLITEKNLSKSTINSYKTDLISFRTFIKFKKLNIVDCNIEVIYEWVSYIKNKGFVTNTILRKLSVLKQLFYFLYKEKYIIENFVSKIIIPKKKSALPKFLDEKDVNKILRILYSNKKNFNYLQTLALTEILYATGVRVSELVTLKIGSITDDYSKIFVKGKGNKERIIPLGNKAKEILSEYLKSKEYKKIRKKNNNSLYLFPSGKKHITRQTYYKKLKFFALKAGLNPKLVSPHVLRHAFASHMLKNGADLKVIQYFLGHEDISTVEIYTHVNLKDTLKAIKKHPINSLSLKE